MIRDLQAFSVCGLNSYSGTLVLLQAKSSAHLQALFLLNVLLNLLKVSNERCSNLPVKNRIVNGWQGKARREKFSGQPLVLWSGTCTLGDHQPERRHTCVYLCLFFCISSSSPTGSSSSVADLCLYRRSPSIGFPQLLTPAALNLFVICP